MPDVQADHYKLIRKIGAESTMCVWASFWSLSCPCLLTGSQSYLAQPAEERQALAARQAQDATARRLWLGRRAEHARPAGVRRQRHLHGRAAGLLLARCVAVGSRSCQFERLMARCSSFGAGTITTAGGSGSAFAPYVVSSLRRPLHSERLGPGHADALPVPSQITPLEAIAARGRAERKQVDFVLQDDAYLHINRTATVAEQCFGTSLPNFYT